MRVALLAVVIACGKSASSPAQHCADHQAFYEYAFGIDDRATLFVESCTRELAKPGAASELACRDRCLENVDRSAPARSDGAERAYRGFTDCEVRCLGGTPGPQRVK